jgi:anti-sigma B factor antagonist
MVIPGVAQGILPGPFDIHWRFSTEIFPTDSKLCCSPSHEKGRIASSRKSENQGYTVNFSATIRQAGEVSIVDLTGHLNSFASGALREALAGLLKQGRKKIILNAGGLLYLDSSGVGELVHGYMRVIKLGGEMKVIGLSAKVEEILKITQLYRIFQEFGDEEAALQSFPEYRKKSA